jgi:hypothetical protein
MSIVGELDKALRRAGIPIDGCAIARFDAVGELAVAARKADAWRAVALTFDFGETALSPEDGGRVLTTKDAEEVARRIAELEREIARLEPMIADPDTRPWDRARWRVDFKEEATEEQRQQAARILADFDPATVKEPVLRSWPVALSRLTPEEFGRLRDARRDDLRVDLLYARAMAQPAGMLDMNDPEVVGGFALLVSLKVFDEARIAELFAA